MTIAWHLIVFIKQKKNIFFTMFKMGQFVTVNYIRLKYGRKIPVRKMVRFDKPYVIYNDEYATTVISACFFPSWARRKRACLPLGKWGCFYCTRHQWTINMHITIHFSVGAAAHKKKNNNKIQEPFVDGAPFISPSLLVSQLQCPTCAWQNCNRDLGSSRT